MTRRLAAAVALVLALALPAHAQVLTVRYGAGANRPGILTIQIGTGLTGAITGQTASVVLANTAVTPGTYGAASSVPQLAVDQQGRLTLVTSVPIAIDTSAITSGTLADARLPDTGVTAGVCGDGTHVCKVTFDAKGRAVAATAVPIPSTTPTASITASATATPAVTPETCPTNADGSGAAQQGELANGRPICAPTKTVTPTVTPTATLSGTVTTTPTPTVTATPSLAIAIVNAASTGTTASRLVKLTGAPSTAVIAGTADTTGIVGVCIAGCGTTGSATVQQYGQVTCDFDAATTAGGYVIPSTTTAGKCHDAGTTLPTVQVIGVVPSTNGSAGAYSVTLLGPNPWTVPATTRSNGTGDSWTTTNDWSADLSRSCTGTVCTWTIGTAIMRTSTIATVAQMPATLALNDVHKYFGSANNFDVIWNTSTSRFEMTGNARFMSTLTLANALAIASGGLNASDTPTSARYLRGDGTGWRASSVAAAGAGACTNQVVTANVDNAVPTCTTVTSAYLTAANKTEQHTWTLFDTTNALVDTMDIPSIVAVGDHAQHITKVCCEVDTGTTTVNLQRDDGSATNILSSNLTCGTNFDPSGSPGTGCTATFVSGEDALSVGHKIDFVMVSAGTAKRLNVLVVDTID